MFKYYSMLMRLLYIIAIIPLFISCNSSYDHVNFKCAPETSESQEEKDLESIKNYLVSQGTINLYGKDQINAIYSRSYSHKSTYQPTDSDTVNADTLDMFSIYDIEYKAYLMDANKTKKETLFDQGNKRIQPYLGPYYITLPRFGNALSKLKLRPQGSKYTIDFYISSSGAFASCGWPHSPFGVAVPPNTPVHFVVTVTF
ncbi:MAG: hypothetical protein ACQPRJ_00840 [Solitalea-like symbiont of Acarus siro]